MDVGGPEHLCARVPVFGDESRPNLSQREGRGTRPFLKVSIRRKRNVRPFRVLGNVWAGIAGRNPLGCA